MEIPVLNRISDFEVLHQSPSNFLISQSSLSFSGIARFSHAYTFWKWGAFLLLALVASFSGLLNLFVLSFRRLRPLPSQPLFQYQSDADTDTDEEDEDEETDSDSESESETEEEDFDFRVRGSGKLRLRHRRSIGDLFSWADLAPGNSVVKLWDNLGLGLDFQDDGNVFSLRHGNREQEINYFLDAPAVAVSAAPGEVKVWDRRVSCRIPAMIAEWHSQSKRMVSFNASGFEKLLVDMRKPSAPLRSVADSEGEAWWDADAATATDEDLSLARCCDAVRSHFLLGRDPNL